MKNEVLNVDYKKRTAINILAVSILEALDLKFPIDIEKVPELLNGKLTYVKENIEDNNIEAKISKKDDTFEIEILENKPEMRRRFSIAHELGHLFLHMGYLIDPDKWSEVKDYKDSVFYRDGYSQEEYEANEFAGAFLMPEEEFKKISKEHLTNGYYDIEKIAEYFKVSTQAASMRGRWLGIFDWE